MNRRVECTFSLQAADRSRRIILLCLILLLCAVARARIQDPQNERPAPTSGGQPPKEKQEPNVNEASAANTSLAILLEAKTVKVIAPGSQPGFFDKTRTFGWLADPKHAQKNVEDELKKWNRLTLVEDAAQADLIMVILEWNEKSAMVYQVDRLLIYKGHGIPETGTLPLWKGEAKQERARDVPAKMVTLMFRKYIENSKQQPNKK